MSQPQDMSKYTAASAWSTTAANTEQDLTLPSGAVCRVRKPGMEEIMMSGMMDMVDSLGMETEKLIDPAERRKKQQQALVASKGGHHAKSGAKDETGDSFMRQMAKDPSAFKRMMQMIDKVAAMTVIIPDVQPMPMKNNPAYDADTGGELEFIPAPEQKQEGVIYTDAISFEDKFALLDFGMGDLDKLKQFRDTSDPVGAVQPGEGDDDTPVGSPGSFV